MADAEPIRENMEGRDKKYSSMQFYHVNSMIPFMRKISFSICHDAFLIFVLLCQLVNGHRDIVIILFY